MEVVQESSSNFDFLSDFRKKAKEKLAETPFPTPKVEDWRFFNLRELSKFNATTNRIKSKNVDLNSYLLPEAENSILVFINGEYQKELSNVHDLPAGVILETLQEASSEHLNLFNAHLGKLTHPKNDFFVGVNDALLDNGVFIYVPKNTKIEKPIHILNVVTAEADGLVVTPRCLMVMEHFTEATLIEDFIGIGDAAYMNIPVTEIDMQDETHLQHYRIQRESKNAIHLNRLGTDLGKSADYQSYTIHFGAKLSRSDVRTDIIGEYANSVLDGLVLVHAEQESDTHTMMHHQNPNCTSHQLHKVVVDEKAHSIFNGKIYVDQIAQKTDSFQENRNILLSDTGTVNTKPQLEIYADDVKCSHGATIGQLDDEEVFYLKSRGLDENTSKELLLYGFALEVIENLKVPTLVKQLSEYVSEYAHQVATEQLPA